MVGENYFCQGFNGIIKPVGGKVYLNGKDITEANITERAKLGIGYAFQHPPKFKGLKVKDILEISLIIMLIR